MSQHNTVAEDHPLGSACCSSGVIHLISVSIRKGAVMLQCWVAGLEDCVEVDAEAWEVCADVEGCVGVD